MGPVANRPWIEHLLLNCPAQGVRDVILAIPGDEVGHDVASLLGDGSKYGVHIAYLTGWEPGNTAGALRAAEPLLQERFLVAHADIVQTIRLDEAMAHHVREGALATVCLLDTDGDAPFGHVSIDLEGRVIAMRNETGPEYAPSNLTNSGVYMMSKSALTFIPATPDATLEETLFPLLIGIGSGVAGYIASGYWKAADTPERYRELHWDVLDRKLPLSISGTEMNEKGIWIGKNATIGKGVLLVPPVLIGDYAIIGDKAIVGPYSVVGNYCRIGAGARIARSIVLDRSDVGVSARLSECVIGNGVHDAGSLTIA